MLTEVPRVSDHSSARQYLQWGKSLGERLPITLLPKLRTSNIQTLIHTSLPFELAWRETAPDRTAIIIPAHDEEHIGALLGDISGQLLKDRRRFPKPMVVVAINGEGTNPAESTTYKAVQKFRERDGEVSITPLLSPVQGKLSAHHEAMQFLRILKRPPGTLVFCDADHTHSQNALRALADQVDAGATAASIGIHTSDSRQSRGMGRMMNRFSAGGQETALHTLHGGAFAITSTLAPLYMAFTGAFPGVYSIDNNWTYALQALGHEISVDTREYTTLPPSSTSVREQITQHTRWLQGLFHSLAFINVGAMPFRDVFKKSNGRSLSMPEVIEYAQAGGYIGLLLSAIALTKNPVVLGDKNNPLSIGGHPPNFFRQKGWKSPSRV